MPVKNSALNSDKTEDTSNLQQDIKIEFVKKSQNNSSDNDISNNETNNNPEIIKSKIEDINQMKLDYIEKQYIEQRENDIKLNTDIDFHILKNKYNSQQNNSVHDSDSSALNKDEYVYIKENTANEDKEITLEEFYRNKRVLIDAGPTYEKIDDVRFIGNHSSGKMGFALAEEASNLGAQVVLIAGPVHLDTPKNVYRVDVCSAEEMYKEVIKYLDESSIIILAAAVADFTPANKFSGKIKKDDGNDKFIIELIKTKDILFEVGRKKTKDQKLIGFALEAENLIENAKAKLEKKNCDMIVANKANQKDSGFGGDNNTITLIKSNRTIKEYAPMTKHQCASEILKEIINL